MGSYVWHAFHPEGLAIMRHMKAPRSAAQEVMTALVRVCLGRRAKQGNASPVAA